MTPLASHMDGWLIRGSYADMETATRGWSGYAGGGKRK
jgi:hypothetical protein